MRTPLLVAAILGLAAMPLAAQQAPDGSGGQPKSVAPPRNVLDCPVGSARPDCQQATAPDGQDDSRSPDALRQKGIEGDNPVAAPNPGPLPSRSPYGTPTNPGQKNSGD